MTKRKSLGRLIGETIGVAAVVYPAYGGLSALVDANATFIDELRDPKTAIYAAGVGILYLGYQKATEIVERYKSLEGTNK